MTEGTKNLVKLTATPEFEEYRIGKTSACFLAHIEAPVAPDDHDDRGVVSLSAVLDKSGSMAGEKLKLVKKTVEFLVNQMRATDKLGVVEYDSSVNELVALSKTDPLFKAEASRIIRTMTDGSCTNLSGGLFKGVEQQQKNQYVDWTTVSVNRAHDAPVEEEEEEQEEEDEEEEEGIMQQMVQNLAGPPSGSPVVQQANVQQTLDLLAEEQDVQQADDAGEEQDVAAEDGSDDDSHRGNGGGGLAGMFGRMMRALRSPLGSSARAPPPVQQQQQDPSQGAAARVSRRSQRRLHMARNAPSRKARVLFGGAKKPKPQAVERDAVRSVFLFTDGLANEGVTETSKLVKMVRKMLDASPRVRISTFGFGADHDSAMLRALAEAGSGIYYYLESAERIPIAFADALGGLLAVTCQNAELRFTPAKGVTLKKVHTRFPTKQAPGNSTVVSLGDLLAEEVKDILFDVDMPECGVTETFEVGALELTYLDVESVKTVTVSQRCSVGRVAEVAPGREGNVDVAGHRARWEATEAMEEAERLADAGKMDEARAGLENVRAKVNQMSLRAGRMKSPISPMLAALETDLNEATQRAKDRVTWQGKGKNWFSSKANEHRFQRSAALNDDFDVEDELEGIGEADAYNKKSAPAAFTYANRKQRAMKSAAAAALRR